MSRIAAVTARPKRDPDAILGARHRSTDHTDNNIAVVDTATQRERGRIVLDGVPISIAFTPASDVVYVAKTSFSGQAGVAAFRTATDQLINELPLDNPTALVVAPDGQRLYVIPARHLTIVRLAHIEPGEPFSDSEFLRLLAGKGDSPR